MVNNSLYHHGISGQKWGRRRFQNEDGTLTEAGRKRYGVAGEVVLDSKDALKKAKREYNKSLVTAKLGSRDISSSDPNRRKAAYDKLNSVEKSARQVSKAKDDLLKSRVYVKQVQREYELQNATSAKEVHKALKKKVASYRYTGESAVERMFNKSSNWYNSLPSVQVRSLERSVKNAYRNEYTSRMNAGQRAVARIFGKDKKYANKMYEQGGYNVLRPVQRNPGPRH